MTSTTTTSSLALVPSLETAWQDVDSSFERFCLTAGIGAIEQMLCEDAQQLAGMPHSRDGGRVGPRWGRTKGKVGFHGGGAVRLPDGACGLRFRRVPDRVASYGALRRSLPYHGHLHARQYE